MGSFVCTEGPGVRTRSPWRACDLEGHADANANRLQVVCTSDGMHKRGGMAGCKNGPIAVWERV